MEYLFAVSVAGVAVLQNAVAISSIRLVVNADGFGQSETRNRGVLAAHQQGAVTSTSVLGNATNPQGIRDALAAAPGLGVGVLLTLDGGAPVAKPEQVPSLLGADGNLRPQRQEVFLEWAKNTIVPAHVEAELDAQVARLRDLGLVLDHLCLGGSARFLPMAIQAMESVARHHGIAGLRTSVERPTLAWTLDLRRGLATAALGAVAWYSRRQLGARRHGPQSWGYFERGRLDEIRILEIIGRLGPGSHEMICEADDGPNLAALGSTRVRDALARRSVELCRWSDLF